MPGALQDVLDDRERILAARVVGRDDDVVGPLHGDGAHHGPLAAVAVASGAEHADHPAVAELAGRLEHDVERVGRVRVVDDDRERLALVDRLEPAGHAGHRPHALGQVVVVDVEQDARGDHAEDVLDVEPPAQRRLDLDARGPESAAVRPQLEALGPHLRRVREPEGDERRPPRLDELEREPAAVLVAHVHRRRRRLRAGEEAALRLVVVLHRPVQVEVILREVREDERVEADAVEPVEHRAVGRGLDRDAPVAGVEHLAEEALEVDRLGRRVRGGPGRASDDPLDGADEPGRAAGGGEHRAQQERGGRLPVRARHAGDLERARRLAEEDVGGDGHRGARVLDEELRHVELERPLDDEGGGAGRHRARREVVPVGTRSGNAEEHRAGRDAIGVVGEVGDLDGSAGAALARGEHARQVVEVHGSAILRRCGGRPAADGARRRSASYWFEGPAAAVSDAFVSGASGGTSRYWSANRAMSRKAGAATTPP